MQSSQSTNSSKPAAKGFAFSADIALAVVVMVGFLFFLTSDFTPPQYFTSSPAAGADAMHILDSSGFVAQTIDSNGLASSASLIRLEMLKYLPAGYDAKVDVYSYYLNSSACAISRTMSSCFPDVNMTSGSAGSAPSSDRFAAQRMYVRKQQSGDCNVSYISFSEPQKALDYVSEEYGYAQDTALFDANELNVIFDVNVSPSTELACDQNATVTLSVSVDRDVRKPIDLMFVIDRSGSMSWGATATMTNPYAVFYDRNYAYVADGSSGLRDVNVFNPLLPTLAGTYNSPGTARDVYVSGNFAYLADGTSGLRIVNVTTPASPSSTGSIDTPGTSYGVYTDRNYSYVADGTNGLVVANVSNKSSPTTSSTLTGIGDARNVAKDRNYAYVVTVSAGSSNMNDFNIFTGTGNIDLNIGRTGTDANSAAQSFVATSNTIRGVDVYVKKNGNPGNMNVSLRSTLTGANLANAVVSSVGNSYGWENADFGSDISLTVGSTYYIVISKVGAQSSSVYYLLDANNANPYSGGNAYQSSTSLASVDGFVRFYHYARTGLNVIDVSNPASPVHKASISGTDPQSVSIDGNRAYFSDGSAGIKAIDISTPTAPTLLGSYNTTGNAYALEVSGNYAYVADDDNVTILNVSNPASITFARNYAVPYSYLDIDVNGNYGYLATNAGVNSYQGLNVIDLNNGPRIDNAKTSAQNFVDFNGWELPPDKMGLASFNTSATLDINLSTDKNAIKSKIAQLIASGGTNIESGIRVANTQLTGSNHNPNAIKFEVVLSDGQSNAGNSAAAALDADRNDIIIYTIAFGADADTNELATIASLADGNSYIASDANALQNVFELIALAVAEKATDSNVIVPVVAGSSVSVLDGNAVFSDGNIFFNSGAITTKNAWSASYTVNFPCLNPNICTSAAFTFPGSGTKFRYTDSNGAHKSIDFNNSKTLTFLSRDLNVDITAGRIPSPGSASLDVTVANSGKLDANATTLKFYLNDLNSSPVASYTVPALCSTRTPLCSSSSTTFPDTPIPGEGVIYARINDANTISECPLANTDAVNCYGGPGSYAYIVKYSIWRS